MDYKDCKAFKNKTGFENQATLEEYCFDIFTRVGWDTKRTSHSFDESMLFGEFSDSELTSIGFDMPSRRRLRIVQRGKAYRCYLTPDIALFSNNKLVGCVEVWSGVQNYTVKTPEKWFLLSYRPDIFFIYTNGYIFNIYARGQFCGSLTMPPSPKDIESINSLLEGD